MFSISSVTSCVNLFPTEHQLEEKKNEMVEKIQIFPFFFFLECFFNYKTLIRLVPLSLLILCFTSLLCKMGCTIIFVDSLGIAILDDKITLWDQFAFLLPVLSLMFLINYFTCYLVKYITKVIPTPEKVTIYVLNPVEEPTKVHDLPWKDKMYLSFTNIFIISGEFNETR